MMLDNLLTYPLRWILVKHASRQPPAKASLDAQWRAVIKVREISDYYLMNLIPLAAGLVLAFIFVVVLQLQSQTIAIAIFLMLLFCVGSVIYKRAKLLRLSEDIVAIRIESESALTAGSKYTICIKSLKGVFEITKAPQFIWKMMTVHGPDIRVLRVSCQIKDDDTQIPRSVYCCEGILPKDVIPTDKPLINVYAELQLWIQGFRFAFIVPIKRPNPEVGE